MSSDGVVAKPEDVKKLAVALGIYQQKLADAGREVEAALHGASWHDRQKDRFEARLRESRKAIDRFSANEVQSMVRSLNELARRLEEIQRMRM